MKVAVCTTSKKNLKSCCHDYLYTGAVSKSGQKPYRVGLNEMNQLVTVVVKAVTAWYSAVAEYAIHWLVVGMSAVVEENSRQPAFAGCTFH